MSESRALRALEKENDRIRAENKRLIERAKEEIAGFAALQVENERLRKALKQIIEETNIGRDDYAFFTTKQALSEDKDDVRKEKKKQNKCKICGYPIADTEIMCGECACEDDCRPD